jgi:hypothetical protein
MSAWDCRNCAHPRIARIPRHVTHIPSFTEIQPVEPRIENRRRVRMRAAVLGSEVADHPNRWTTRTLCTTMIFADGIRLRNTLMHSSLSAMLATPQLQPEQQLRLSSSVKREDAPPLAVSPALSAVQLVVLVVGIAV